MSHCPSLKPLQRVQGCENSLLLSRVDGRERIEQTFLDPKEEVAKMLQLEAILWAEANAKVPKLHR